MFSRTNSDINGNSTRDFQNAKKTQNRLSLPTVIFNAFSFGRDDVVYSKKVNDIVINANEDKRSNSSNHNSKPSLSPNQKKFPANENTDVVRRTGSKNYDPFMQQLLNERRKSQLLIDGEEMKPKVKNVLDEIVSNPNDKIMSSRTRNNINANGNNYSYATTEFRPMEVRNDGLHTTPINDKKENLYSYTHVNIRQNNFDKENNNLNHGVTRRKSVDHTSVNGDLYAVVEKDTKTVNSNDNGHYNPTGGLAVSNGGQSLAIDSLYASVDRNAKNDTIGLDSSINFDEIRRRGGAGRRITDGMIDTPYFVDPSKKLPPKIPKPYAQSRNLSTHMEEGVLNLNNDLRTRLNSFNRNSVSTEDMLGNYTTIDKNYLQPVKNNVINTSNSSDRLSKSQNNEGLKEMNTFRKQHRRMKSHETVVRNYTQPLVDLNDNKDSSSSGKSSALSEASRKSSNSGSFSSLSVSKESEDDLFSEGSRSADINDILQNDNPDELPEGWQEEKYGSETYYWHLWTGTIQYERPRRSATPSSSSRSISPHSSIESAASMRGATACSEFSNERKRSMTSSPMLETPPPDKPKQVISFPVHSMGWMDVDESKMEQSVIGDTVNTCITELAEKRHDLWNTSETWAEGSDIKLVLEGETLKLVEPKSKNVLHTQPIAKMRVWGVGRTESRDFAYIARDQVSGRHRCHMFRCHGHVSGRSITNALQTICNRVLEEKRRAKERSDSPSVRTSSDLLKPPSKTQTVFNEKPYAERKKCFTAKYVGQTEVSKQSGIDLINKAVTKLSAGQQTTDWSSVLIEVSTSEIKTIDCIKQITLMEHRVRYITFLAVAQDERFAAYIVAVARDTFMCYVFFCAPHAGTLTKAIEEACKLRFEKMLDGRVKRSQSTNESNLSKEEISTLPRSSDIASKSSTISTLPQQQQQSQQSVYKDTVKEKTKFLTSSIAGVFTKLNKRDNKKKDEEQSVTLNANEYLVKYFGSVTVDIGTGIEAVQKAVNDLAGGQMMVGYLEVQSDFLMLTDSQRSALSKRTFDVNAISYCGMTSDRKHFGVIISCGKGKYICHVFQEYKPSLGQVVSAIHDVL